MRTLFYCAPFWRAGDKEAGEYTWYGWVFITDGLRSACGGGNDTKRRGWIEGSVEWYHTVGQSSLPKDAAACQHALELLDEQHSNWRALLAPMLELLYVAQQRAVVWAAGA